MSFRKSPQLTLELFAAARENARQSSGPRSPAAKQPPWTAPLIAK